jgi:hypothetical protein
MPKSEPNPVPEPVPRLVDTGRSSVCAAFVVPGYVVVSVCGRRVRRVLDAPPDDLDDDTFCRTCVRALLRFRETGKQPASNERRDPADHGPELARVERHLQRAPRPK